MTTLADQPWLTAPETVAVLDALEAAGGPGCVRFVGGSVRNVSRAPRASSSAQRGSASSRAVLRRQTRKRHSANTLSGLRQLGKSLSVSSPMI